jgi:hypothetical protein
MPERYAGTVASFIMAQLSKGLGLFGIGER